MENKLLNAKEWEKLRVETLDDSNYVVIDVRTPEEFQDDGIPEAINIDCYSPMFSNNVKALDKDKNYLIYCRSGARSGDVREFMCALGFNIYDLDGGMFEYSEL